MIQQEYDDYEERRKKRLEVLQRMKQEKEEYERKMARRVRILGASGILLVVAAIVFLTIKVLPGKEKDNDNQESQSTQESLVQTYPTPQTTVTVPSAEVNQEDVIQEKPQATVLSAQAGEDVGGPPGSATCSYAVLIDVEAGKILCQKEPRVRMNPASMTKILTVLVAAEHIDNLDDTFVITREITDYCFVNDCSNVGFEVGEEVKLLDLFYGTIMPSGADAALALAYYVAGSQEAFVELMNDKLKELGIDQTTHFTNCVGLYGEDHYSTVYDMAVILKSACDNDFVRGVLAQHVYTTSPTPEHEEGIVISNLFLRRIEDYDSGGEVLCAKTGYVAQSKSCAASLARGKNGREYICVTAGSDGSWPCIYDHRDIYKMYLPDT